MKFNFFSWLVEKRIEKIKKTLLEKMVSYMENDNVFHNFEEGSQISNETREEVLDGYLLKHLVSYRKILREIKRGKVLQDQVIDEKFGDIINYFIIQEIQTKETNDKNRIKKNL